MNSWMSLCRAINRISIQTFPKIIKWILDFEKIYSYYANSLLPNLAIKSPLKKEGIMEKFSMSAASINR